MNTNFIQKKKRAFENLQQCKSETQWITRKGLGFGGYVVVRFPGAG